MRLRDFEYRFEETLKANKLEFTIKTTTEAVIGITWTWKTYSIKPRSSFDLPLLVTLCKCYREGSAYARRRARTSCSCFVVPPHGLGDKSRPRAERRVALHPPNVPPAVIGPEICFDETEENSARIDWTD